MTRPRGRRRATSSTTPKRIVSLGTLECEILAYLDYCVMFAPDHRRFKQTIKSHLERSIQKSFHFRDIDRRIRRLWSRFSTNGVYESIYHYGSRVLSCVQNNSDLRDRIRKRAEEIRDDYAYQRYKANTRATRSKHLDNHISLGNEFLEYSPRRVVKRFVVEIPAPQSPEKRIQGEGEPERSLSTVEVFHDAQSSLASPTASAIPNSAEPQTPSSQSSSPGCGDDDLPSPSVEHSISTQEDSAATADLTRSDQFSWDARASTGAEEKPSYEVEIPQDLQSQFVDLRRQAKFYEAELRLLKERNADLQRLLTSSENTIHMLKNSDEASTKRSLVRYQTEVQVLQSKLRDRALLGQFTSHQRKYPIGPDPKEIEDDMTLIETGILNLLASSETMSHWGEADFSEQGEDLSCLCHEAFGKSTTTLPRVPFQSILRSLTSVAICKWAFESDLDEPYFANSRRGDTMLDHLATQDGEDVARNLDFAALTTLIESDYCQNILLPKRALGLADRLSTVLAPLLTVQERLCNRPTNVSKKWEREKSKLKSLFETALRIKVKTLVGEWVYEVVLPSSGDPYDKNLMRVEGPLSPTSPVQLVLAPGVCRYQQRYKRVDCNSFRPSGSGPQQGFDWVQRALVKLQ